MVSGDLQVFPLLQVMQTLLSSGRSGQFMVEHPRGGSLWLEQGEIVHARSGDLTGEAALQLMCSLDSGTFTYEASRQAPEHTLHMRVETALRRMYVDSEAWDGLLRLFPDWSRTVRFSERWHETQPVTRPQYLALSQISQGQSLRSLVNHSELLPRQLLELLKPFLTNGLIEVV